MSDDLHPQEETRAYATVRLTDRAILARDLHSFVVMWNPAAAELYGYSEDEALGRMAHDLLATRFPCPREDIEAAVFETGSWHGPLLHLSKSGEPLLVISRWVLQRTPDGEPHAIVEFNRRAADPLEELRLLAPIAHEPVDRLYIHEPVYDDTGELVDLRLRYANEEVRYAQGAHPIIGMPTRDWFPGFCESRLFELSREVLETSRGREFQDVRLQPPWVETPFVVDGQVIPFGDLVVVRARDVTVERRALQELDDAQARVRLALAVAPVEVAQTDRDLVVRWVADTMLPAAAESLVGRPLTEILPPEEAAALRRLADDVLITGEEQRAEFHPDVPGAPVAYSAVIHPWRSGDETLGLMIAGVDVSEHQRVLGDLAESHALVRAIVENAPDAVWVKDLDGRYRFANELAAQRCGLQADDVPGRTAFDLYEHDVAERLEAGDRTVTSTGGRSEATEQVPAGDGSRTMWLRRFPVRDAQGMITGVGTFATDISEEVRRQAETELRAAAMCLASVAISVVRPSDMTVLDVNDHWCEQRGLRREDVIGRSVATTRDLLGTGDDPAVSAILDRLRATGSGTYRVRVPHPGGAMSWVDVRATTHEHPEHGLVWILVAQDVDAEVQLERRLSEAEAELAAHGLA